MKFLLGIVMILGITLLWKTALCLEWSIPLKWQILIKARKEGLSSRTHTLKYVWYMGPEYSELEKQIWHFKRALPRLQKKFSDPLWIEVNVQQSEAQGQHGIYISCLQRRFPEIEIHACPLSISSGEDA